MLKGFVRTVKLDAGFGFVAPVGEPDLFFHESVLIPPLEFNEQLQGWRVEFERELVNGKLRATFVRAAS